ncbi:MAG: recombinase family protein [Dehalococcoidales bacterium]|nr:recombinase family protein [Dehalococcoidales bacterium]
MLSQIHTSGPGGRFVLRILGAIAELERGITAERVAKDIKPRAGRGKSDGEVTPYSRRPLDGRLVIVPEEAELMHRMRLSPREKRNWRGVTIV